MAKKYLTCPFALAAWRCENYLHSLCEPRDICQDEKRRQVENDEVYTGHTVVRCKGYEIAKRFKLSQLGRQKNE